MVRATICIIAIAAVFGATLLMDSSLISSMIVSWDRIEIFNTTMRYLKLRPILGFGGNTLDQLIPIFGNFSSVKNWGHTHNWLLEVLLRYGIVGAILFSGFLLALVIRIRDADKKFMFLLMCASALFQIYMRDFVFLFFLAYLANETNLVKKPKNDERTEKTC